jgi:hypothetical protein
MEVSKRKRNQKQIVIDSLAGVGDTLIEIPWPSIRADGLILKPLDIDQNALRYRRMTVARRIRQLGIVADCRGTATGLRFVRVC